MSIDELYKGLDRLKAGVTDFASSRAINEANQQVQDLNKQEMKEAERLQALNNVSTNLSLRLAQAGANPGQIEALASRFGISSSAQFQAVENEKLQDNRQKFQASESKLDRELQEKALGKKSDIQQLLQAEKQQKRLDLIHRQEKDGFEKRFAKNEIEAMDKIQSLRNFLKPVNGRIDSSQVEASLVSLVRLMGQTGALTETEINNARAYKDRRSVIARKLKLELSGEALKDDVQYYTALVNNLEQANKKQLGNKARAHATSLTATYKGLPKEDLADSFLNSALTKYNLQESVSQPAEQQQPVTNQPAAPQDDLDKYINFRK